MCESDCCEWPRINRAAEAPCFVEDELCYRRRYRHSLPVGDGGVVLRYRISRPWRPAGKRDWMGETIVFCWITARRRRIGAFELHLYEPDFSVGNEEFWSRMDADSALCEDMATVLCSAWDDVVADVVSCGPILDFRWAWINPKQARGDLFTATAPKIIDAVCPDHSILVMKAFPLEYAGRADENPQAFVRRQQAMIRLYRRVFGVEPFPGPHGARGWLWRANFDKAGLISDPSDLQTASELF
jgi:hypothetical protein